MSFLSAENLLAMAHDPALFRDVLRIEVNGSLVPLGSVMEPWQRADFEAMDGAFLAIAGRGPAVPVRSFWHERCRGASKSSDLVLLACWTLLFARSPVLLIAAAGDKDQAGLMRDAVARLIAWNPWLGGVYLEAQKDRVINQKSGSELRIISSDAPTAYGLTCHAVLVDELSHFQKPDLWHSLLSTSAKKPNCVTCCILNAGWQDHWLWPIREAVRQDPSWRFSRQDRPPSWISDEELARQTRLLPGPVYERLFENRWVLGAGSAFNPADVDRLVDPRGGELTGRERGWAYYMGLDLAVSRDDAAAVVIAKDVGFIEERRTPAPKLPTTMAALIDLGIVEAPAEEVSYHTQMPTGRYKLAAVRVWKARGKKIDLTQVESEILALHRRFGCSLAADPYQAELLLTRLQKQGVRCKGVAFTPSSLQVMSAKLLDVVREQHLSLYSHEDLIADLKRLRVEEKPYGFRLTAERVREDEPGTVHADAATALQISLHATQLFPQLLLTGRRLVYN